MNLVEQTELTDEQFENLGDFLTQPERHDKNVLKILEEMAELSEVLLKTLTKREDKKPPVDKIIEEAGDVFFRLAILVKQYGIDEEVMNRMDAKSVEVYEYYIGEREQAEVEA